MPEVTHEPRRSREEPPIASPPPMRVFSWREHASLWFSLGVGLLVLQAGAYLTPLADPRNAAIAVVVGSIIGSALLGWTARIACTTGLPSAGLMSRALGQRFARLPVLLNIAQLAGWTTFELVVMRDATLTILRHATGLRLATSVDVLVVTLLWGGVLLWMLSGSMLNVVRKLIGNVGLPLIVLSLLWLTWQYSGHLGRGGIEALWGRSHAGGMGLLPALDLVIAMPVSWLPVVADYARHGAASARGARQAFSGTWLGYSLANIWCYGLGFVIAGSATPGVAMLTTLVLAQGGLVALGVILVDDLGNLYGAAYSSSVSANSLSARWSVHRWGMTIALACTALAVILPMHGLAPFLLWLSSIFVPLYGVILGRLGGRGAHAPTKPLRAIDVTAALIWLGGIALYHILPHVAPEWGSTLPTLAATFFLSWLTRSPWRPGATRRMRRSTQPVAS